jgi:hypothetical protein
VSVSKTEGGSSSLPWGANTTQLSQVVEGGGLQNRLREHASVRIRQLRPIPIRP